MQITEEVLCALQDAVERSGGAVELARKSGVNAANLSRYLNGKVHSITDSNWEKLAPFLGRTPWYDGFRPAVIELRESCASSSSGGVPPRFGQRSNSIRNSAELREFIKDAMLRRGVRDAADLCRMIGYDSVKTITRLLSGQIDWFSDILAAVFDALDLDPSHSPLSEAEKSLLPPQGIYRDGAMLVYPVPLVDWANAASHLATLSAEGGAVMRKWDPETTETVPAPVTGCRDLQAFRAAGLSMEPRIQDGDILFAEPVRSIDDLPNRKIVIVKFKDSDRFPESVVCKRFHRRENDSSILLTSDNPEGKIITCRIEDLAWIGLVVRKISDL